jgi:hypothetical protein
MPASANIAPPGYYYLSIVNNVSIPSLLVIIGVNAATPPIAPKVPEPSPLPLITSLPIDAASRAFASVSQPGFVLRHKNFVAFLNQLNPLSSGLNRDDSSFYTRKANAAEAGANCYSFESKNLTTFFLRQAGFRLYLKKNDGSALFAADSTFCVVPGLSGSGFSLQSFNYPSKNVHVRSGLDIWIDDSDGSTAFAEAATFTQSEQYLPVDGNPYSFEPWLFPGYLIRHVNFLEFLSGTSPCRRQFYCTQWQRREQVLFL